MNIAERLRNLPQKRQSENTEVENALKSPKPHKATDKLNNIQVVLVMSFLAFINTKQEENMLLKKISRPEIAK